MLCSSPISANTWENTESWLLSPAGIIKPHIPIKVNNPNVFKETVERLNKYNIEIVVHIINGLPFETKEMMLETVNYLNNLNIHGIKIHSLFILKNTKLAEYYLNNEFDILSMDEYVDITVEQLALIRDDIVIHRINGDAPRSLLIEPQWSLKKLVVMNEIDKLMKLRNYYQGCKTKKL